MNWRNTSFWQTYLWVRLAERTGQKTLSPLEGLSFHQECAKFDLGLKCSELGYEVVNFDDLDRIKVGENFTQQYLSQLTDIIYANGEVPFASVLNVIENGIHVTHDS